MWKVSNDSVLWKGKGCGVGIKDTTSKLQQFYIRLQLQSGELGDTDLTGKVILHNDRGKPGFRSLCHPQCSLWLGMEFVPWVLPHQVLQPHFHQHWGRPVWSERDLSLLLYRKTPINWRKKKENKMREVQLCAIEPFARLWNSLWSCLCAMVVGFEMNYEDRAKRVTIWALFAQGHPSSSPHTPLAAANHCE